MNTRTSIPPAPPSLAAQIAALPALPMADIRALWQTLIGGDTPTHNRQFLERRLAYRLQEVELRKTNRPLLDRHHRRIESLMKNDGVKKPGLAYRAPAGTLLSRYYGGVTHQVLVTPDGQYDYQGQIYRSLSKIAREITGTQWSGPVFFGLAASGRKPAAKQGARR